MQVDTVNVVSFLFRHEQLYGLASVVAATQFFLT